jgi:hypothetical protein
MTNSYIENKEQEAENRTEKAPQQQQPSASVLLEKKQQQMKMKSCQY